MKEARHKVLYSVWFLLYDILEKQNKTIEMEHRSVVDWGWGWEDTEHKGAVEAIWGVMELLKPIEPRVMISEFYCIVNSLPDCERYLHWNADYDKEIELCYK